jgi:hypothetical protein
MAHSVFGSDRPLLYNVTPWAQLGFGVANFGDNYGTLSTPIWGLADFVGKSQLYIMTHIDAQRTQPPSRNTVERLCKLINRVQSVLNSRMKIYSDIRLEEGHATADMKPWLIHPVPFFPGSVVRNHWLSEYNQLVMIALTNIYQHSDNNLALTITQQFASDIWKYFKEIKYLVGIELLQLSIDTVEGDDFVFTEEHYKNYGPDSVVINFEPLDSAGPIMSRATEDDLRPLFRGWPANEIITNLSEYPVDAAELGKQGQALPDAAAAVGTADGSLISKKPGGTIGHPQL